MADKKMMDILRIRTTGISAFAEIPDTLEAMQAEVGGYIEIVRLPEAKPLVMVVNEEGLLQNLPVNVIASRIYGDYICGNAFLCKEVMGPEGGELAGMTYYDYARAIKLVAEAETAKRRKE